MHSTSKAEFAAVARQENTIDLDLRAFTAVLQQTADLVMHLTDSEYCFLTSSQ